jgi:hypothetical protein
VSVSTVQDGRPPAAVVAVSTAVLRPLLATPLGRPVPKLARLDFDGRRTGRHHRIVTGWYVADGKETVFTPATWRANFAGGRDAEVWQGGRRRTLHGRLVTDPATVADLLTDAIARGTKPGSVGLKMPKGHRLTDDDVQRLDRAAIVFDEVAPG